MKYYVLIFILLFSCKVKEDNNLAIIEKYFICYDNSFEYEEIKIQAKLKLINKSKDTLSFYKPNNCSSEFTKCNYILILNTDTISIVNNYFFKNVELISPSDTFIFHIDLLSYSHYNYSLLDIKNNYQKELLDCKVIYRDNSKTIKFLTKRKAQIDFIYNGINVEENDSIMQKKLKIPKVMDTDSLFNI